MRKDAGSLSQDDNLVNQVFGGLLVSKLRCCNCGHSSDTYEPSIDLSLEIEDVDTLLNALESFTRVEKIEDGETKFTCEKCKEEVSVEKQLMLEQLPVVCALHLKRFKNFGSFVEKIDKHVEFPLELDLGPYTSGCQDNDLKYDLYAVIVHTAFTSTCGHYYCFIRSTPDTWYKFDDSKVIRVQEAYVLSQEAYILFYAKQGTPWFSCFMETYKPSLDTLSSASPKSVLDNVDISISPINVTSNHSNDESLVHAIFNHCTDTTHEITEATNEIPAVSLSQPRHAISESTEAKVDFNARQAQLNPGTSKSMDGMYNKVEKVILPSVLSALSNPEMGKSCNANVATKTPPRSPSPDIYKEEISPEIVFSIKRAEVKSVDRMSCKRQLNNDSEDPQVKEARKQCKNMPVGRRAALLAAMGGSQSEGSVNKKSKKRMTSNRSRDYTHSSDRIKSNRYKFSRPLAATASSQ